MNIQTISSSFSYEQVAELFLKIKKGSCEFNEIVSLIKENQKLVSLYDFSSALISELRTLGHLRLAETYSSSVESLRKFIGDKELYLQDLNCKLVLKYESYLLSKNLSPNTTSFYMRNLRSIYNRAVDRGLVIQSYPFKRVYTGVEATRKRALPLSVVKKIMDLDIDNHSLAFARDIFILSFYLRGISFVDLVYLTRDNLKGDHLVYRRKKTNQELTIKWESCMQDIVDRYSVDGSKYLLPILKDDASNLRRRYLTMSHNVNRNLRIIGDMLNIEHTLTLYVARHTWASAALSKKVPISIISQAMGHDSEKTTRIYLSTLDTTEIDNANLLLINSLR